VARGFFPLDEDLELGPGAFSPRLVEGIVLLGTQMPFERVPHTLDHFTRVEIGVETARRLTERAGAALEAAERVEAAQLEIEWVALAGPPVQQLSVDGAMVPLVGGVWAEVKTLAIGTIQSGQGARGEPRTTDLSYFSRLTDAVEFTELARVEVHRRGTDTAGTVCAVADGAEWLQGFVDCMRPDAIRILDFPHAAEHLSRAAQAAFGPGTAEASEWLGRQLHELKHGNPDTVLEAVRTLETQGAPCPNEAEEVCCGVLNYLEKRREQVAYAQFQAQGFPIGSGAIESANKLLVEARLKGSGMHWERSNVNSMLTLRCALCSGRWKEIWPQVWRGLRGAQAHRRRERRLRRHPPPPEVVSPAASREDPSPTPNPSLDAKKGMMVNGHPTDDHPWKRDSLSHPTKALASSAKV
jgi:hypothetical protein